MRLEHVGFEVADGVGVITLDRPEVANAQSLQVLRELDQAWGAAEADREVKVIVLRSTGKHFSAGHDLTTKERHDPDRDGPLTEWFYDWETRHYLHYAKRWREVPKPSIAAVQGKCIAAGLLLCWPCDLIVAADNAEFSDPVLRMGLVGVELHAHAWELGARKAKEHLFTGGAPVDAHEALRIGMVNRVVPLDQLVSATLELAGRIAQQDAFALRLAKRAVNRTLDIQGYTASIDAAFDLHHLGHARATVVTGGRVTTAGLAAMKAGNQQQ